MRADDIEQPAGPAPGNDPLDHDASRRVRETDLLRELDEFTARHSAPPETGRDGDGAGPPAGP